MRLPWPYSLAGILAALAVADGLLLLPLPLAVRMVGALLLFVLLPGHLLVQAVFNEPRGSLLERRLLGLGCGFALAILLELGLYLLFRPLSTLLILGGANVLVGALLTLALARQVRRPGRASLLPEIGWLRSSGLTFRAFLTAPVLIVLVAAPFRLWNLGHSEFQGDESLVILRTMAVLQGIPDALIAHRKPPGEILLNAAFAGGLGSITEATGRLPFALAGLAATLVFYRLARVMFGPRVALVAGLLLAVNGYFIAFGRILQYQSAGFLLDALAVLCLYRFARGTSARRGYAVVGGLLMAGSALMGLNAIFLLPVAVVALWRPTFGPERVPVRDLLCWLWPLAPLLPAVAFTYFLLPNSAADSLVLESAMGYLGPRLGGGRPYFNLQGFLLSFNHYTSSPYVALMLGGGLLTLLEPLLEWTRNAMRGPVGGGAARAVPAIALAWLFLDSPNLPPAALLAGAVALLLLYAQRALAWKLALVWMAAPLFTHLFLIRTPGTHYREFVPGLLLLVGYGAVKVYDHLTGRPERLAALLLSGVFLVGTLHYVYVAWIQPWPEYQLLYPTLRHPLDWRTDDDTRNAGGTFGAARRHGWKTVAELVAQGQLPAAFTTNERPAEAAWYLKRSWICDDLSQLFVRSPRFLRDRAAIERGELMPGYARAGSITTGGQPTLGLYTRQAPNGGPRTYASESYGAYFDQNLSSPWLPVGRLYRPGLNSAPICPR